MAAASINPVDLIQRSGESKGYFPLQFAAVIGWDLSGTVLKLGPSVKDFSVANACRDDAACPIILRIVNRSANLESGINGGHG